MIQFRSSQRAYVVSVLYPHTGGLLRDIVRGILEAAAKIDTDKRLNLSYFATNEAHETDQLLTIKKVVAQRPDLIISVGYIQTKILLEQLTALQLTIPVICTATDVLTVEYHKAITAKENEKEAEHYDYHVTAKHTLIEGYAGKALAIERSAQPVENLLRSLAGLLPSARRILVPFVSDSSGMNERTFKTLQNATAFVRNPAIIKREAERRATLSGAVRQAHEAVYNRLQQMFIQERKLEREQELAEPYCSVSSLILSPKTVPDVSALLDKELAKNTYDAVLCFEDFLLSGYHQDITRACAKHAIMFFSSHTEAVFRGACAGYGGNYRALGSSAFESAYNYLIKQRPLSLTESHHVAITREYVCNVPQCRTIKGIQEKDLQTFLRTPRVTVIE